MIALITLALIGIPACIVLSYRKLKPVRVRVRK